MSDGRGWPYRGTGNDGKNFSEGCWWGVCWGGRSSLDYLLPGGGSERYGQLGKFKDFWQETSREDTGGTWVSLQAGILNGK